LYGDEQDGEEMMRKWNMMDGREMEMRDERASSVNAPRVQVQVQVVVPLSFIHRSETRIRSVECWLLLYL
jgi:hypothetical protein